MLRSEYEGGYMILKMFKIYSKSLSFFFCVLFVFHSYVGDVQSQQVIPAGVVKIPLSVQADSPRIDFSHERKLIISASISKNLVNEAVLFRFLTNGKLDSEFGNAGMATVRADGTYASITSLTTNALTIQPDGKIVVAGQAATNEMYSDDFLLMRFLADGQPDKSFNGRGWDVTGLGKSHDQARDVVLLEDGKIIAVGGTSQRFALISSRYDFAIVRYLPNSSLDLQFAKKGKAIFRIGNVSEDFAYAVARDSLNRIIVGGKSHQSYFGAITLIRVNENGELDKTFGKDGVVKANFDKNARLVNTKFGELHTEAESVFIQPDQKILVAGSLWHPSSGGVVLRYNDSGKLDSRFGNDGLVRLPWVSGLKVVKTQLDGKIILLGTRYTTREKWAAIVVTRLNSDGTLDKTFGSNGITMVETASHLLATGMAISKDDEIFVCGSAGPPHGGSVNDPDNGLILFKLNRHGNLDQTFGR
jgi:uncharacterized delta-60 repeat protein